MYFLLMIKGSVAFREIFLNATDPSFCQCLFDGINSITAGPLDFSIGIAQAVHSLSILWGNPNMIHAATPLQVGLQFRFGYAYNQIGTVRIAGCVEYKGIIFVTVIQYFIIICPTDGFDTFRNTGEALVTGTAAFYGNIAVTRNGKVMDEEIQLIAIAESEVLETVDALNTAGLALVNTASGVADPVTDTQHQCALERSDFTLRIGTDIQQIVGANLTASTECFDKLSERLAVYIFCAMSPMRVHSLAHFCGKILGQTVAVHGFRTSLFKSDAVQFDITDSTAVTETGVVYDNGIGLMLTNDCIQSILFPILIGFTPVAVEPQTADFAVFRTENFNRITQILQICLEIVVEIRIVPVQCGVVEEGNNTFCTAAVNKIANKVPANGRMRCIIGIQSLCIKERKTFVVTSGRVMYFAPASFAVCAIF